MSTERTLVLVKPDGVQRGLVGTVVAILEKKGLKIVGLKMLHVTEELAAKHYSAHTEKPFYRGLVNFITSSPLVAVVLEGPRAVEVVRNTMGGTNPTDAAPGTIRGDFGLVMDENVVHGSDSVASAEREIPLFFPES